MKKHKDELIAVMGKKKYDEEMRTLVKMIDFEAK